MLGILIKEGGAGRRLGLMEAIVVAMMYKLVTVQNVNVLMKIKVNMVKQVIQ